MLYVFGRPYGPVAIGWLSAARLELTNIRAVLPPKCAIAATARQFSLANTASRMETANTVFVRSEE